MRTSILRAAVLLLLPLPFLPALGAEGAAGRPNILFIFSDDHAQHAISAYGSKVNQTPNIDRLAKEGTRFQHSFVANSICTPSRATLLTGQYSHRNGVPVFNQFEGERDHVGKRMQAGGYHTGVIGKWHLGSAPTGFDRWIVLPGQGAYWNPQFLVPGHKLTITGHCTDVTTDLGIEFLKTRPADKPFFLMLHQKAPHRSWQPDERNKALFKDKVFPEPATLWDDYATRPAALPANQQTVARDLNRNDLKMDPPAGLEGKELIRWKYNRYMQDYLACVQGVDDGVGRVLDYLDQAGLASNTIVIYSADNGWYLGDLGLYDKRFMYEPGLQVPLLARGPGIKAGHVPAQFVGNIDLAPTFLDLAGLPVPESMQGRSLAPLLRGESPANWRTSFYYRYYHDPGHHNTAAHYGVRTATHKLIHYWKKDAWELFDLAKDPTEQNNLLHPDPSAVKPGVAALFAELKTEIVRLQKEFQDEGQYADPATWPRTSADGPFDAYKPTGQKSAAEAIAAAAGGSAAARRNVQVGPNPESVTRGFDGKLFVTLMGPSRAPGAGDGQIVVLNESGKPRVFTEGMDDPKGLVFAGGNLIAADFNRVWKVDAKGVKSVLAGPEAFPHPPAYLNDVVVSPDGQSVLVTDMGAREKMAGPKGLWPLDSAEAKALPAIGRVYRIALDGKVTEVIAPDAKMPCPNGVDVLADGRIRIAEFFTGAVLEWSAGTWKTIANGHRSGDGIVHDSKGRLYLSEVGTGNVWRYEADGSGKVQIASGLASAADHLLDEPAGELIVPDSKAGTLVFIPLN